ncbi:hypothetical protein AS590_13760 [Prescottella equi]|jgi:hypothetical protein|uniref:Uncharacterized protein n=2 Tax=Rhodococcus erythropolis group TaxID=2840174 RepID=A0A6G9CVA0_RHOER|nr:MULTISPECIES: hypothetical protein [Rhodococcus]OCC16674.1 hypothetical protein AS590_13760 [Prescottella equi]AUS32704.1 hypothetical protein C1M55_17395 [Rhodococcus qingshengii]AZI62676.1 hypothetical protein EHW12_17030 [Rhodococcus sp. NJ-530]EME18110.1 hypothetical protein G418_20539 [Rhodococcus qingshengii BKS 20-40]KZL31638.1 hypothetical protein A3852_18695 [Rhodococcus qingshengii]
MTPRGLTPAPAVVAVVVGVAAVVGVGFANPVPTPPIRTDTLGPDSGEAVPDYLDRARDSVASVDGPVWALVSFTKALTVDEVITSTSSVQVPGAEVSGVRVSRVMFRVPIERVQTPLMSVPVPDNDEAVRRSPGVAATRLVSLGGDTDRQQQVALASAKQLSAGCACAVGVLVRATPEGLEAIEHDSNVRAVEALPSDASPWLAAVRPLLPEYVDVVAPGPDDGPVP